MVVGHRWINPGSHLRDSIPVTEQIISTMPDVLFPDLGPLTEHLPRLPSMLVIAHGAEEQLGQQMIPDQKLGATKLQQQLPLLAKSLQKITEMLSVPEGPGRLEAHP